MPYAGYQPAHEIFLGKLVEVNWDTKTYVGVATGVNGSYDGFVELLDENLNILKSFSVNADLMGCAVSGKGDVAAVGYGPVRGRSEFIWKPFSEYYVWGYYEFVTRDAIFCLNGSTHAVQKFSDSQAYNAVGVDRDGNFSAGYYYGGAAFLWYPWWVATIPNDDMFYWLTGWHQQVDKYNRSGGQIGSMVPPYGSLPGIRGDIPNNKNYDWSSIACDGEGSVYCGSHVGLIKFSSTGGIGFDRRLQGAHETGVCTDNKNNVYFGHTPVSWTGSPYGPQIHFAEQSRVYKMSKTGGIIWSKDVEKSFPVFIAVDAQRSVYIAAGTTITKTPEQPAPPAPAGSKEKPATAWSAGINGSFFTGLGAHKKAVFASTRSFSDSGSGSSWIGNVTKYDRDTGQVLASRNYPRAVMAIGVTQSFGPRTPPPKPTV